MMFCFGKVEMVMNDIVTEVNHSVSSKCCGVTFCLGKVKYSLGKASLCMGLKR